MSYDKVSVNLNHYQGKIQHKFNWEEDKSTFISNFNSNSADYVCVFNDEDDPDAEKKD